MTTAAVRAAARGWTILTATLHNSEHEAQFDAGIFRRAVKGQKGHQVRVFKREVKASGARFFVWVTVHRVPKGAQ